MSFLQSVTSIATILAVVVTHCDKTSLNLTKVDLFLHKPLISYSYTVPYFSKMKPELMYFWAASSKESMHHAKVLFLGNYVFHWLGLQFLLGSIQF